MHDDVKPGKNQGRQEQRKQNLGADGQPRTIRLWRSFGVKIELLEPPTRVELVSAVYETAALPLS